MVCKSTPLEKSGQQQFHVDWEPGAVFNPSGRGGAEDETRLASAAAGGDRPRNIPTDHHSPMVEMSAASTKRVGRVGQFDPRPPLQVVNQARRCRVQGLGRSCRRS